MGGTRTTGRFAISIAMLGLFFGACALPSPGPVESLVIQAQEQGQSRVDVRGLAAGDCIADAVLPPDLERHVTKVPCDQPHWHEVVGVDVLPRGDGFPGNHLLPLRADELCRSHLEHFTGHSAEYADHHVVNLMPDEGSWHDGDRIVICLVRHDSMRAGSIAGRATRVDAPRDVSVYDLRDGQCIGDVGSGEISSVRLVPCDRPHAFEVYGVGDLQDLGPDYPGDAQVGLAADEHCYLEFESYAGVPYEESPLDFTTLWPTREGWEQGDRGVVCLLITGPLPGPA